MPALSVSAAFDAVAKLERRGVTNIRMVEVRSGREVDLKKLSQRPEAVSKSGEFAFDAPSALTNRGVRLTLREFERSSTGPATGRRTG